MHGLPMCQANPASGCSSVLQTAQPAHVEHAKLQLRLAAALVSAHMLTANAHEVRYPAANKRTLPTRGVGAGQKSSSTGKEFFRGQVNARVLPEC